jgi:hypothetical protein
MPRGIPAFSRVLTGLVTGALLITTLQVATAPANAADQPAPDRPALLGSALDRLPAPPGAPDEREPRPDLVEAAAVPIEERPGDAPMTARGAAPVDTSGATSEVVAEGAIVRGTVTDSTGATVEGVLVSLYGYADDDPYTAVAVHQTSTAADGTWEISGVDAIADYWVAEFTDPQGRFAVQYWNAASVYYLPTPIELTAGAVVEGIDARLVHGATLAGTVTGGQYTWGPATVWVDLYVYDWTVESWMSVDWRLADADGAFSFEGLAPDYYALSAIYISDRGIGVGVSDLLWVDEGIGYSVELPVDRQVVGGDRDLSGDWVSDVLAITSTGALKMYRGNGQGGWAGASQVGNGWTTMNTVFQAGDFSGDGHSDVMARDASGNLKLFRGNGAGGWLGSGVVGTGWGSFTSIFGPGDFDGDGNVDVMARDKAGGLHLYRGNGAGGWLGKRTVGSGWQGFNLLIGAGDIDSDANADVITRDSSGRLWLYPGNGSGGWLAKRQVGSGWLGFTAIVGVGDFTSDHAPDLLARDAYGRLFLYAGNGGGGWSRAVQAGTGWNGLRLVA